MEEKGKKKKVLKWVLLTFLLIVLLTLILISPTIIKIFKLKSDAETLVSESTKETFKASENTVIYDVNGNELCTMRDTKDMYYTEFGSIPSNVTHAFLVMEDKKFYTHRGIDLLAIARAVVENKKNDYIVQGASTITQQLARTIFLTQDVTWERKIEEMFAALAMEKKYSKENILEYYLNNIYFANGYYGIESASRGYFNKSVSELSLSQQVFLSAIPKRPSKYNPVENYDNTVERRNLILKVLYEDNKISSMDYYAAIEEVITVNKPQVTKNNYAESYIRHCATESLMLSMGFKLRNNFESDADHDYYTEEYDSYFTMCQQMLLGGGYKIYTSIDLEIQEKLQRSVDENLSGVTTLSAEGIYELQGAATCIDNLTGNVVAIVGGRSQDLNGYTLNRAYQSYRQPGSSIKPLIVYTPYLQLGANPDTVVVDEYIEGGPSNADGIFSGSMTLRDAVKYSKNTVAWKLYSEITPKLGSSFLMQMGFAKIYMDREIVSGSLGGFTYGVSTEEMASAYAALQNDGVHRRATCIVSIVSPSGAEIVNESGRGTVIYNTEAARMMTDMLKTAVTSGTGKSANIQNAVVAGKTGTTNSNKDAWFVGYSRYYTTSAWIGYDMPKEMESPAGYVNGIWKQFMTELHDNLMRVDFPSYKPVNSKDKENSSTAKETQPQITPSEKSTESPTGFSGDREPDAVVKPPGDAPANVPTQPQNATNNTTPSGDIDVDIKGLGDKDVIIN